MAVWFKARNTTKNIRLVNDLGFNDNEFPLRTLNTFKPAKEDAF